METLKLNQNYATLLKESVELMKKGFIIIDDKDESKLKDLNILSTELDKIIEKFNYQQLVVWEAMSVGADKVKEFEKFILDELGTRIKYAEEVTTKADSRGPGGRNDIFFWIHQDDISKFAVKRFHYGNLRWWEDVLENGNGHLYPIEVLERYTRNH
jgi:hypothetical protein